LAFYAVYDSAAQAVRHVVKLPGARAGSLVRALLAHRWSVPETERTRFPEVTSEEWLKLSSLCDQRAAAGG
jgi:hypothetical protein